MVTCPSQISTIETQPTVSWVTEMTRHERTNDHPESRTARRAPGTVSEPREARTCSSTAITVLVPNSQARRVWGASVRSTSHSGTTTLSSTWLELSTPLQADSATNPWLRQAGGAGVASSCSLTGGGAGRSTGGSTTRIITALSSSSTPVRIGTATIASVVPT